MRIIESMSKAIDVIFFHLPNFWSHNRILDHPWSAIYFWVRWFAWWDIFDGLARHQRNNDLMIWGDIKDIFGETSIFNNSLSYKDIYISNPLNLLNIYSRIYFGSKKIQRFRRRRGAPFRPSVRRRPVAPQPTAATARPWRRGSVRPVDEQLV